MSKCQPAAVDTEVLFTHRDRFKIPFDGKTGLYGVGKFPSKRPFAIDAQSNTSTANARSLESGVLTVWLRSNRRKSA